MNEEYNIEIYMKKIKKFFENNESKYFYKDIYKDIFLKKIREVADKNFKEKGSPELTREQIEEVRIEVKFNPIKKNSIISYNNIGIIYLN